MSKIKILQRRAVTLQPVPPGARRRLLPAEVTPEGAALGVGVGLTIFGGAAVLAEALVPGGVLLSAGLACLGVSWKASSGG